LVVQLETCGNPYLEYHHFDPSVHVKPHNDPRGMIALCAQHHKKTDGHAYPNEQLHEFKTESSSFKECQGGLGVVTASYVVGC
jgi:hypothetical protein